MGSSQGRGQGWVQVGGQGQGGVKVVGQGNRSRSWGQGQGHDWWSHGRGSRSVVKV